MRSTRSQTPVSAIGSASIAKPGLTPVPSTATFAFFASCVDLLRACRMCVSPGYASSSVVDTIGSLRFRISSICGITLFSDERVQCTTTSGLAALIALPQIVALTFTRSWRAEPGHVAEIASGLRRIDVDGADDFESRAGGDLLRDGRADRSEAEMHHANVAMCGDL